jgi:ribosomal-protein-alanine N-acetyltransferase
MAELKVCEVKLAAIRDAGLIARMSRDYIEHGLRWRWRAPQIRAKIRHPETAVIVAEVELGGVRFIGGFAAMDFGEDKATLSLLAVHPNLRRRGIGGNLVQWLHKSASVAGCQHIELQVRASNVSARRFYGRMGYAEEALINGYYDGTEAAYQMKFRLAE